MTDNPTPDTTPAGTGAGQDLPPAGWYVQIDRQHDPRPLAVGPYRSREVADSAFTDALLIDDLCQTDCLDADVRAATYLDTDVELCIVDPADADHHGPVR